MAAGNQEPVEITRHPRLQAKREPVKREAIILQNFSSRRFPHFSLFSLFLRAINRRNVSRDISVISGSIPAEVIAVVWIWRGFWLALRSPVSDISLENWNSVWIKLQKFFLVLAHFVRLIILFSSSFPFRSNKISAQVFSPSKS